MQQAAIKPPEATPPAAAEDARGSPAPGPTGLLARASVELSTNDRERVRQAASLLPRGTEAYVPKLPRRPHATALPQIQLLRELGFRPVPHVAARDLESTSELERFLAAAVKDGGADRLLVLGGDATTAAGPFADGAAVIGSGVLEACGIRRVDVAGYPDGHPVITPDLLRTDLARKADLAQQRGVALTVVTQFSFFPGHIADYCEELARRAPGVPVRAGVPGPTSIKRLLHFARICGVTTSLRAINKLGLDTIRLLTHADTQAQWQELARRSGEGRAGNLESIHLFTFGGFVESATWLAERTQRQDA